MPAFHVTYDVVTDESAAHSDCAETGFVDARGNEDCLPSDCCGQDAARFKAQYDLRLREALELMGCCEGSDGSYYETDGRQDYRTGAVTRYALHVPDSITVASLQRLERLLRAKRLLR